MILETRFDGPLVRLQAILGWLTLVLVLLTVVPRGGDLPIVWALLALGATGLMGLHVLLSLARPAATAVRHAVWPGVMFGAVVIWLLAQALLPAPSGLAHPLWALAPEPALTRIGANPGLGAQVAMRLASYAAIAWLFVACALNETRAWSYLKAIALFSAVVAAYAIWAMMATSNPLSGMIRFGPDYTTGPFVSRNAYACYAAFGLFTNIAVFLHLADAGLRGSRLDEGGNRRAKLRTFLENFIRGAWLYAVGVMLCGAALVLTQSRVGNAAALVGLLVFAGCMLRRQRGAQWSVWFLLLAGLGYLGFAYDAGTLERLMAFESGGGRLTIYAEMLPAIAERPILGQGAGTFQETFRAHVPLEIAQVDWTHAHNSYLENIYEFGLPAAALMYLALALVAGRLILGVRLARHYETTLPEADPEDDQIRNIEVDPIIPSMALAALATAAVYSLIDYPLELPGTAALFAAIMGIGWAQSFTRDDRRSLPRQEVTNDI